MDDQSVAVVVVGGLVIAILVNELIKLFFAKMRRDDYVEKTACERCQNTSQAYDMNQGHKIDAMAKLVLAMAIKMGIDVKEIQGIM